MNFQTAIKTCLTQKYATFQGRASRSEFWWFGLLFVGMSFVVFWSVEAILNGRGLTSAYAMLAFQIVFLPPFLAVIWRRCLDLGLSGWVGMIPFFILTVGIALSAIEARLVPSDLPGLFGALAAFIGFLASSAILLVIFLRPSLPDSSQSSATPHEVPQ